MGTEGDHVDDVTLPAFEMDCRDWTVSNPEEIGLPEDLAGAPLLAVLSTVIIDEDIREVTGALTVGVLDDDDLEVRELAPGSTAVELLDFDRTVRRYVMPAPDKQLAVLAEFEVGEDIGEELGRRVDALMTSFRWQAA